MVVFNSWMLKTESNSFMGSWNVWFTNMQVQNLLTFWSCHYVTHRTEFTSLLLLQEFAIASWIDVNSLAWSSIVQCCPLTILNEGVHSMYLAIIYCYGHYPPPPCVNILGFYLLTNKFDSMWQKESCVKYLFLDDFLSNKESGIPFHLSYLL